MNSMEIISRQDAAALGLKKFFTGVACAQGHFDYRSVSNSKCCECNRQGAAKDRQKAKNDPLETEKRKLYHKAHKAVWSKTPSGIESNKRHWKRITEKRKTDEKFKAKNKAKSLSAYYERKKDKAKLESFRAQRRAYFKRPYVKAKLNAYFRAYQPRKRASDPTYAMKIACRSMIARFVRITGIRKTRTTEMLGYNAQDLRRHIESKFLVGMGWHNRNLWHIDHITPVAHLIRIGVTDPAVINALENLQPLWAVENMAKGDNIAHAEQFSGLGVIPEKQRDPTARPLIHSRIVH